MVDIDLVINYVKRNWALSKEEIAFNVAALKAAEGERLYQYFRTHKCTECQHKKNKKCGGFESCRLETNCIITINRIKYRYEFAALWQKLRLGEG